ncbi:flavodoxin [Lachnospiraceae bacterium 47-T17]
MIKKIALSLLSLLLLFAFAGCGAAKNHESSSTSQTAPENTRSDKETDSTDNEQDMDSKVLVAYFSCTNTTKELAEYAAEILGADLYEIVPEDPYTESDLAYYTDGRADQEQNDPSVRPTISGEVENMSQYDTIVLGYPIWHGQAPRIISTFLESYDFSEKAILPFCTSHSSGIGSSADNLHPLCPDSTEWLEGERFEGGTSRETLEGWLEEKIKIEM